MYQILAGAWDGQPECGFRRPDNALYNFVISICVSILKLPLVKITYTSIIRIYEGD
jgi:hypothetical protein